jgi:hypothetical protein
MRLHDLTPKSRYLSSLQGNGTEKVALPVQNDDTYHGTTHDRGVLFGSVQSRMQFVFKGKDQDLTRLSFFLCITSAIEDGSDNSGHSNTRHPEGMFLGKSLHNLYSVPVIPGALSGIRPMDITFKVVEIFKL